VFVKMDPFAKIVERMAKAGIEKAERATALEAKKVADAVKKTEKAERATALGAKKIEKAERAMALEAKKVEKAEKRLLEAAKRLIKEGINLELIAKATDLSLETVQGLQA